MLPTSESLTCFSAQGISRNGSICYDSLPNKQKKSCTIEQINKENYFTHFPTDDSIKFSKLLNQDEDEFSKTMNLDLLR